MTVLYVLAICVLTEQSSDFQSKRHVLPYFLFRDECDLSTTDAPCCVAALGNTELWLDDTTACGEDSDQPSAIVLAGPSRRTDSWAGPTIWRQ